MAQNLLPTNATTWEQVVADVAIDEAPFAAPVTRIRSAKLVNPEASFVPFLIAEYGLGELTPYVLDHYRLLRDGVRWQRLRGTTEAVRQGLSWLDLAAEIREARSHLRFWNSFQLYLTSLPLADQPDLERIENITTLSVSARSKLRRGVHGYDVPAIWTDRTRLDGALLDTDSGVGLRPGGPRWSFGRRHEAEHLLTEAEGVALGNWIEPVEDIPLRWVDAHFSWQSATTSWASSAVVARRRAMASWFVGRVPYLRLSDVDGAVIGYRRARVCRPVLASVGGPYRHQGARYAPGARADAVYVEALTGFGDGLGQAATHCALIFAPELLAPSGRLWLQPDEIEGGTAIGALPLAGPVELRAAVRQRFTYLLRF